MVPPSANAPRAVSSQVLEGTALLDAIDAGVAVFGADGRVIARNHLAVARFGVLLAGLSGGTSGVEFVDVSGRVVGAGETPLALALDRRLAVREVVLGLRSFTRAVRWFVLSAVPQVSPTGDLAQVVVTMREPSSAPSAANTGAPSEGAGPGLEDAGRQARELLERVTEAVPGLLFQLEQPRVGRPRFRFLSGRAREWFGDEAGLSRRPLHGLFRILRDDRRRLWGSLFAASREGTPWQAEFRVRDGAGALRWIRLHAQADGSEAGSTWTGMAIDISDERKLRELVERVHRRESVAAVTAGVAHNFNNALAIVLPNLDDALELASPEQVPLLRQAVQAARGSAGLVDQLLRVARADPTVDRGLVDLVEVVRSTAPLCARLLDGRAQLETRIEVDAAPILADADALQQVLINLSLNARDAMSGRASPRVVLTVAIDADGRSATVSVEDNGAGMSEETLRRLGEPFFTTKGSRGTGLGLATAHATLREHEGTLGCRSVEGQGTVFELRIPLARRRPSVRGLSRST